MDAPPAMNWWDEVRARIRHTAQNIPSGIEQQTMLNLLADPEALELVFEPYVDLEPRFGVLTTSGRKPPLRTGKFLGFRGELLSQSFRYRVKVRTIRLLRTHSPQKGLRSNHEAAQRAETARSNGKSAIFGLKTADLNGGFRPVVVSTRGAATPCRSATRGEWTKPISRCAANGCTCIEPSISRAGRLISS
jgi:hypothetical protein